MLKLPKIKMQYPKWLKHTFFTIFTQCCMLSNVKTFLSNCGHSLQPYSFFVNNTIKNQDQVSSSPLIFWHYRTKRFVKWEKLPLWARELSCCFLLGRGALLNKTFAGWSRIRDSAPAAETDKHLATVVSSDPNVSVLPFEILRLSAI